MKILSDIRLLLVAIWIGAAVFFIGVAQNAFAVLPQRDLAGAVVNRNLALLNYSGLVISVLLILTSLIGARTANRILIWIERLLLIFLAACCAVGQFIVGWWIASVRARMGPSIEEIAIDDPLRVQFNMLHEYSVWILITGMASALIVFFLISNRRAVTAKIAADRGITNDPFDFTKEFRKS
jgi:hypothetical protein